jgi:tetratricopeptide (TPR) repeat protein
MNSLPPPHSHLLSAAEGWLGLGNLAEARLELDQIEAPLQAHPAVLDLRWAIAAQEKDWPAALAVARQLVAAAPGLPQGWLHQAYATRRVKEGGLQAAWDSLFPVLKQFPEDALIPYNLACYACQLEQLELARDLLKKAMARAGKPEIKTLALQDADLQLLWPEISLY